MRKPRASPYSLHDPRQRVAIAILTAAAPLPADMAQCLRLWRIAGQISPGLDVTQARLGDRVAALRAVRAIVHDLIVNPESPPPAPDA